MEVSRIGLIGDVHAEHQHLSMALDFLSKHEVDAIVCTGDVADGRGSLTKCCDLLSEAKVLTVRGNHDRWFLDNKVRHIQHAHLKEEEPQRTLDYLAGLPAEVELETPQGTLLLCHGICNNDLAKVWPGTERVPVERSAELDDLIASGQHRWVINGHLHYRVMIDFQDLTLINAGTLRNLHRPGFSIMDFSTECIESWEFETTQKTDDADDVIRIRLATERGLRANGRRQWRDTQEFDGRWTPVTLYASE